MVRWLLIIWVITMVLSGCTGVDPTDNCGNNTKSSYLTEQTKNSSTTERPILETGLDDAQTTTSTVNKHESECVDLSEFDPYRFLTEVNHSGEIISEGHLVPPGTLPEVNNIPKADQSLVGHIVKIVLSNSFDIVFTFEYNSKQASECLSLYLSAEKIPMLIQLETKLGGGEGLKDAVMNETVIEGKVLSVTNISFQEGMYSRSSCRSICDMGEDIFNSSLPDHCATENVEYRFVGRTTGVDTDQVSQIHELLIFGGAVPYLKEQWLDYYDVFNSITRRFGLG